MSVVVEPGADQVDEQQIEQTGDRRVPAGAFRRRLGGEEIERRAEAVVVTDAGGREHRVAGAELNGVPPVPMCGQSESRRTPWKPAPS
ncbi:hypothetical protein GCM10027445_25210 [Amycolatopsis endophytica]|uniref:Uncharacterized protein n=1 Tax=Amycolatopsis endophytica TaxID=860233 RepID=A0A853BCJ8_9PSEU|nr:hypothetical protein [Amycolatopsis endophytica]